MGIDQILYFSEPFLLPALPNIYIHNHRRLLQYDFLEVFSELETIQIDYKSQTKLLFCFSVNIHYTAIFAFGQRQYNGNSGHLR